ncbi:sensor histidine kinase [Desulfovibrio litoralis]|uniref:histidine kinase n=1 Tax=Desulfovibrio litoralis DSM 11393 TaxID=1121455 RepID=A0A1M7SXJ7_9BACT|nr:HAMP domain-containing sensor histidine kinase [Desulfovibrio litoralis]SHN63225.1 hypothetical protein SAMN02745728_01355 [Desulfovibrio litoralis DSM 11393]
MQQTPESSKKHQELTQENYKDSKDYGFGIAKSLAWILLFLTLASGLLLSVFIGQSARDVLLKKEQGFASLLAENINQDVYRKFSIPTLLAFGRISLRQPAQYERLDETVKTSVDGLNIHNLRIFDHAQKVTYSTNKAEIGSNVFSSPATQQAQLSTTPIFNIDSSIPFWQAIFQPNLKQGSFYLRTTYPMQIENKVSSSDKEGPAISILEFSQDITEDMGVIVRFQRLVIGVALISSTLLFILLLVFIKRAEHALSVRFQERQKLLTELHQNERFVSMGRVVASIAHEIRNPLGIIRSTIELLLKRPIGQDPTTAKFLTAMHDESLRLSQTISDFLDYAKPKQPKQQYIDVILVLEQIFAFISPDLLKYSVDIMKQYPVKGAWVNGDKDLLYRAFYNIIVNSIQEMKNGGVINVTVSSDDKKVNIRFIDSGPGFSQDVLEHLLDPFYTTKDEGTGLGLPIVNSIVSSHGGEINFMNNPEGGAIITIILPVGDIDENSL